MNNLDYQSIFTFRGRAYNEAMAAFPDARENERSALLELLELSATDHFLDTPAGGGYLSEGLAARFGDGLFVTCVEPAKEFGAVIDPSFEVINAPMIDVPLDDGSVTAIGSLAGLHHFKSRAPVFAEWARLLAPQGQLGVADVAAGTPTAEFLNGFVDRHTPQGHDGVFIEPGEFSRLMEENGIEVYTEELVDVPWIFPRREDVGAFCKKLFFLETASEEQVTNAIDETLGIQYQAEFDHWLMNWQLIYASGRKTI
ncbi:class I SAM-dependent methyltransferase [Parvularcula marina]|nr:class I SAM-dependent methyltransferase [Parvularcula marina]